MDQQELARIVLDTLRGIAPEIAPESLQRNVALREQVDLDSMDWLGFLNGLNRKLGVDIPEKDYAKLATLDDLLAYLAARVA